MKSLIHKPRCIVIVMFVVCAMTYTQILGTFQGDNPFDLSEGAANFSLMELLIPSANASATQAEINRYVGRRDRIAEEITQEIEDLKVAYPDHHDQILHGILDRIEAKLAEIQSITLDSTEWAWAELNRLATEMNELANRDLVNYRKELEGAHMLITGKDPQGLIQTIAGTTDVHTQLAAAITRIINLQRETDVTKRSQLQAIDESDVPTKAYLLCRNPYICDGDVCIVYIVYDNRGNVLGELREEDLRGFVDPPFEGSGGDRLTVPGGRFNIEGTCDDFTQE